MQGAEDEENKISHLFQSYLQEMKIGIAFDQILGHLLDEEFSDGETDYLVHEILMPEVVCLFAEKYSELDEVYGYDSSSEDNLNSVFETFCKFEGLPGDLQNLLAATINNHAAAKDDEDDDDDNEAVFKPNDWDELSDDERQAKVKAFLKKIANAHLDARDQKPFLKNLDIGDQENPWGIKVAEKVKTFDRAAHRYGHPPPNESAIRFPNRFYEAETSAPKRPRSPADSLQRLNARTNPGQFGVIRN